MSWPISPLGYYIQFPSTLQLLSYFTYGLGGSDSRESTCNAGDLHSVPGLGRSPGEWNGYPLQYSSILAWKMPWTEEPGRPQSIGLQTVRHDWVTNTFTFFFFFWLTIKYTHTQSSKICRSASVYVCVFAWEMNGCHKQIGLLVI